MKVKELVTLITDHTKLGIVARIDNGDKIETYQTLFSGYKVKYKDFEHVLRVNEMDIDKVFASAWERIPGIVICVTTKKGVGYGFTETEKEEQ